MDDSFSFGVKKREGLILMASCALIMHRFFRDQQGLGMVSKPRVPLFQHAKYLNLLVEIETWMS